MSRLEDIRDNTVVRGILPNGLVTVVSDKWNGSDAPELTYKTAERKLSNKQLYGDEPRVGVGRLWSFDGGVELFRLVAKAQRIRLAHLFEPVLRPRYSSRITKPSTSVA